MIRCISNTREERLPPKHINDLILENLVNDTIKIYHLDEEKIINIWHDFSDGGVGDGDYYRTFLITLFYKN